MEKSRVRGEERWRDGEMEGSIREKNVLGEVNRRTVNNPKVQ